MSAQLPRYLRLLLRPPTLDFQTAMWDALNLVKNPRKAYRSIYYRHQNREHWARDDPSYVVLISLLVVVSAVAWGLAYAPTWAGVLRLMLYMVVVDFLVLGLVAASAEWLAARTFMLGGRPGQQIEWAYSFDVHCNAFLVIWLYLYFLQFLLLPVISRANWLSLVLGNTLYFVAYSHYFLIVFMGYSTLGSLTRTQLFLVPIPVGALFYLLSLFGFSVVRFMLAQYFG